MKNAISVRNLTKTYRLYRSKADRAADIFLPVGTKVNLQLGEVVKGGITVLAELS